jgi:SAP domain-containing new25
MKLSSKTSEKQFDNNYWYANELKAFAKEIGVTNASELRKDELEVLIKQYLKTGQVANAKRKNIVQYGKKDFEKGLKLSLRIVNYINNDVTKGFIEREAKKLNPDFKRKSGSRYRLNRWREQQMNGGRKITYKDLIIEYVRLNNFAMPFKKVPHGRYINFLSDFLAKEKGATRDMAIREWHKLKKMNIPKDYIAWKKFKQ